jgi:hypothetical protein
MNQLIFLLKHLIIYRYHHISYLCKQIDDKSGEVAPDRGKIGSDASPKGGLEGIETYCDVHRQESGDEHY